MLKNLSDQQLLEYKKLFENGLNQTKRFESRKRFNFDVKFAAHLVRLMLECEQILEEQDIDLQRNSEHLKAIRRGDVKKEEIEDWFTQKEKYLEKSYSESSLRNIPEWDKIRELLLNCLEHHYGSLSSVIIKNDYHTKAFREIQDIVNKYEKIL